MKKFVLLVLALFIGCLSGCIKEKSETVNIETASTLTEMIENAQKISLENREEYINKSFEKLKNSIEFPYIDGSKVTFVYKGNETNVSLIGDVSGGWYVESFPLNKIDGTDFFYKTIEYESNAKLEYKFVMSDMKTYKVDPLNKNIVNNEFANSELRMPGYKSGEEEDYSDTILHGTIENKSLICNAYDDKGNQLINVTRNYHVYLPYGYSKDKKYRVIYFQDGKSYLNEGKTSNILDFMISKNKIEPVVAIFIDYPDGCRDGDYIESTKSAYADYFTNIFMPKMESDYSIRNDRDGRIMVGESNSGSFIAYLAYTYPDKFRYLLTNSGAFNALTKDSTMENMVKGNFPVKIYMISGLYEMWVKPNKIFYEMLKNNTTVEAVKYTRYHMAHNFSLWRDTIRDGLKWLIDPATKTEETPLENQKLNVMIGWRESQSLNIGSDTKCYLALMKKNNNTLFEASKDWNSGIELSCIEIKKGVTEKVEIPLNFDKATDFQVVMFYDKNGNKSLDYSSDEVIYNDGYNWDIMVDKEDDNIPIFIVGKYK